MASDIADLGGAADFSADSANTLVDEIGNAGSFDRNIPNPQELLKYKRDKIDRDYHGLRGVVNSVYSARGPLDSHQQKTDELDDAERYYNAGEVKGAGELAARQEAARHQQLRTQLDTAAADETKTDFQRQRESIDRNYQEQLQAANQVQKGGTFFSQGFKSQADANAYAQHMRDIAGTIHTAEGNKLESAREGRLAIGQGRLDVQNQIAAGDETGAAHTAVVNKLDSEELAIDPNDKDAVQQFHEFRNKSLANFDADAARQKTFQAAQSNERISALKEEGKDADLRGAGHQDEARISTMDFSTQQRVRELREQAAAEGDATNKSQLLQEASAADDAGKKDRAALRSELQRTNAQAMALSRGTGNGAGDSLIILANKLGDVSKRLDDAAGKFERAMSNSKGLALLKD